MNRKLRYGFNLLRGGLLISLLALAGCNGDDGTDGVDGINGIDGVDGVAGIDGVDGQDGLPATDILALNPVLDLSNTVSYDAVSGAVTVHFFLTDGEGNGVDVTSDAYELRVYVSELVSGDPLSGEGDAWNQLIAERGTPAADSPLPGTLSLVDAATGEYTYVLADTLAPSSNVIRVTMRARWRETINGERIVFANPVNASYDFLQADPATELTSSGADIVTTAACETCHGARIGDVGHGGGYTQTKTCNHCHNVNYMASRNSGEGDLAFMIHRIHDAGVFAELEDGADFSEVTYPQHIYTCNKCHTAEAPNADLSKTVPTRTNCGSCHETVDFATGANHGGGVQLDDGACSVCHSAGVVLGGVNLDPDFVHNPAPPAVDTPEFDVQITMDPPANGEFYVAGETPVVTVKLLDPTTGTEVNGATYTTAQDAVGVAGGGLSAANLYVYGPRADAVPVLTTNSTTDGGIQQAHPLFTGGTDSQVITNGTGFRYQLMDNIGDLASGTYMVRFEGGDYSAVDATDYVTHSTAVINFQIGTADEEHKVSGDACTNCHGETRMHLQGAHPHNAAFDTDQCLGCHDISGNYGDYIANRVHAIHRASVTGDLKSTQGARRDWSEVTFPQEVNNCTICHTDPDPAAPVWRAPDAVACGGCHGTDPNATPELYPNADPDRIRQEGAAATHMLIQGGDFDITTNPVTQCVVCHGEGRIADLFNTHQLITFPPSIEVDSSEQ